jgi:hypothetical protein
MASGLISMPCTSKYKTAVIGLFCACEKVEIVNKLNTVRQTVKMLNVFFMVVIICWCKATTALGEFLRNKLEVLSYVLQKILLTIFELQNVQFPKTISFDYLAFNYFRIKVSKLTKLQLHDKAKYKYSRGLVQ